MSTVVHNNATPPLRGTIDHVDADARHWLSTSVGEVVECTVDDVWADDLHSAIPGTAVVIHRPAWLTERHVHVGADGLLVVEPAAMIDVTELSELVADDGVVADLAIIRRLLPRSFATTAAIGSMVNAALDAMVEHPDLDDEALLRMAETGRPLQLAQLVRTGDLETARTKTRKLIPVLRQGLAALGGHFVSVEPTVASPDLGMIGRLDILVEDPADPHRRDVIELKAGTPPPGSSVRPSHRAQVVAYDLLLAEIDADRHGSSQVWYPAAQASPMRDANADATWRRRVIQARNRIAMLDRALAERRFEALRALRHNAIPAVPGYVENDVRSLAMDYASLDPQERTYLQAWISYIAGEHRQQRTTAMETLWSTDPSVKADLPTVLTSLSLDLEGSDPERRHVRFVRHRPQDDCSLRLGDLVVVYPVDDPDTARPWASGIVKGTIRSIQADHVDVSLRNKHADVTHWSTDRSWIVEQDVSDGGLRDQYGSLARWLAADPPLRSILMGRVRPVVGPPIPITDPKLMPHQRDVVQRALGARHWFLIQGPPGTGKTSSVIRALTEQLMADPAERVLLLAFTNRAADEIAGVVERSLGPTSYVRLGSKDGARGNPRALHALGAGMPPEEFHRLLMSTRCVVSTVAAMSRNIELMDMIGITTTIIDEASQVLEPQLLGLLTRTGRFILVGDECQLPAVITQPLDGLQVRHPILADIGLHDLGTSYFARLMSLAVRNGWDHAVGRLTEQGRMHDAIGSVASTLFYGGHLRPMHDWQRHQGAWLQTGDGAADRLLSYRMGCIDVSSGPDAVQREADLAAHLATRIARIVDAAAVDSTIGIITPFRTQINAIQHRLPEELRSRITVDTVERYQGSERDVIIVSAAVASQTDLDALSSVAETVFGPVDRKLNVLLTRARQQFLLIGDLGMLRRSEHYARLVDHLAPLPPDVVGGR